MARPILSEFGPDADKPQASRMTKNGPADCGDVMNYQSPQGPINQQFERPDLPGGTNVGVGGSQGPTSGHDPMGGSPGIGGTNHGNCGSQGRH